MLDHERSGWGVLRGLWLGMVGRGLLGRITLGWVAGVVGVLGVLVGRGGTMAVAVGVGRLG